MKKRSKVGKPPALSDIQKQLAIEMYCAGYSPEQLATHFKVSRSLIYNLLKRETTPSLFSLRTENENERKLFVKLRDYAAECSLTVRQLIWVIIAKEMNRAERGDR